MLEHTAARHQPSYLSFVNLIGTINTRILNMATTALIIWNGEREGVREREREPAPSAPLPACWQEKERAAKWRGGSRISHANLGPMAPRCQAP